MFDEEPPSLALQVVLSCAILLGLLALVAYLLDWTPVLNVVISIFGLAILFCYLHICVDLIRLAIGPVDEFEIFPRIMFGLLGASGIVLLCVAMVRFWFF